MATPFFKSWITKLLPGYVLEQDSYKDYQNKGLVVRYLENMGEEIDTGLYPFIVDFMDLFDALKCDSKFLGHLSFILGLPPSIDDSFDTYRKVIAYAISIYKVKGTKNSYQLLFNLIGLNIDIIEEIPSRQVNYDEGFIYDGDGVNAVHYDDDCDNCSYYSIIYNDIANPFSIVPQEILDLFTNIINFLEPINAKLRSIIRRLYLTQAFNLNIGSEVLGFNTALAGAFSDGFETTFNFN